MGEKLAPVTSVIPHREPFLFLDEVTTFDGKSRAEGHWLVRADLPLFAGHFPGRPMVPGVVLTEAIAQLGAYAILSSPEAEGEARIPVFGGIDKARFKRMVEPGETVDLAIELTKRSARAGRGSGTASVNGELACRADLFFVMA